MKKAGFIIILVAGIHVVSFLGGLIPSGIRTGVWSQVSEALSPNEANAYTDLCKEKCQYSVVGLHDLCDQTCTGISIEKNKAACQKGCDYYKDIMTNCIGHTCFRERSFCLDNWSGGFDYFWKLCGERCINQYKDKSNREPLSACVASCNFGNHLMSTYCDNMLIH
jgi:hypothetical protein